jgi:hypothetical protein
MGRRMDFKRSAITRAIGLGSHRLTKGAEHQIKAETEDWLKRFKPERLSEGVSSRPYEPKPDKKRQWLYGKAVQARRYNVPQGYLDLCREQGDNPGLAVDENKSPGVLKWSRTMKF